jgi:hypothetical protein
MRLGCDPEIFLVDAAGGLVSAVGRIGGSKAYPRPLPIGKGFAVQEDNVALEYNIPPSDSSEAFQKNINKIMKHLRNMVAAQGLGFSTLSASSFPAQELDTPQAQEFGCDPDFNAWTLLVNPKPAAEDKNLRSCGGHVHIETTLHDLPALIRRCDLFLGVGSVLQDNGELRKQLYGKAGAFRGKPYGGEYRTLSNYWVFDSAYIDWVWKNTARALDSMQLPVEEDRDTILDAINNNNKAAAAFLTQKYNIQLAHA